MSGIVGRVGPIDGAASADRRRGLAHAPRAPGPRAGFGLGFTGNVTSVRDVLLQPARSLRVGSRRHRLEGVICPDVVEVRRDLIRRRLRTAPPSGGSGGTWPDAVAGGDWDLDVEEIGSAGELAGDRDHLVIGFDRAGRSVLVSGGLPAAPDSRVRARVAIRHAAWGEFCHEVRDYLATRTRDGRSYQRLGHPDFAAVPSAHGPHRLALIREHLPAPPSKLLDIGCNWGHFVLGLSADGYACTGIERSEEACRFARGFARSACLDVEIVHGSVFEHDVSPYETILALNVFHHFLKKQSTADQLEAMLGRVAAETMVFQPHTPKYFAGIETTWNPAPEEFAEWVATKSGMVVRLRIGADEDQRPLYLLRR